MNLELCHRRLAALNDYLRQLKLFSEMPESEYVAQTATHMLAERYLHLALASALDLAADTGVDRRPEWVEYREVLEHAYLDLDHRVSYQSICHELGELEEFARLVEAQL